MRQYKLVLDIYYHSYPAPHSLPLIHLLCYEYLDPIRKRTRFLPSGKRVKSLKTKGPTTPIHSRSIPAVGSKHDPTSTYLASGQEVQQRKRTHSWRRVTYDLDLLLLFSLIDISKSYQFLTQRTCTGTLEFTTLKTLDQSRNSILLITQNHEPSIE